MFKKFTNWFFRLRELPFYLEPHDPLMRDRLIEGVPADQYQDPRTRDQITKEYTARWITKPPQTPATNPELFDPLNPPSGWHYDPYYELWLKE